MDPAKTRSRVQHAVRDCLKERGGREALEALASYRAEGLITLVPERRIAEYVRWVDAAGRMRIEIREKGRGEVRIVSEAGTWSGPDDRSLVFGESSLLDVLGLAVARRDFPAPFAGNLDSLEIAEPDARKRLVLRAVSGSGVMVDHHLHRRNHRLEAISASAVEEPDFQLRVDLGSFRKVNGARIPFRETIYRGKEKLAEIRFRTVEPSPELPEPLFVPRVTPAGS